MARFIDAHCHLDFPVFDEHRQAVLARLEEAGIERLVIPGVRRRDWSRVLDIAAQDPRLYPCLGIHPWFVQEHGEEDIAALDDALRANPACVAVGECGLDRLHGDVEEQLPLFEAQVELACQRQWPLVIHSVHTHEPVLQVLKRHGPAAGILLHGFSGSVEQARQLIRKDVFMGVGGVITYPRARKTREAIARLPLEYLVLESDAPDMPPAGVAKGENTPLNLPLLFEALCELRNEPPDVIAQSLQANAERLYRW